jgi:Big-like domain-containing protein
MHKLLLVVALTALGGLATAGPATAGPATAGPATADPAAAHPAAAHPAAAGPAAAGTPAAHTPAAHTPAAHTPAAHTPAAHTPAAHTPAAGTPAPTPTGAVHTDVRIAVASGRTFTAELFCPGFRAGKPAHGTVTIIAAARYGYTSDPGYVGPDRFDVTCAPGAQLTATVFVTVTPALPPVGEVTVERVFDCEHFHGPLVDIHNGRAAPVTVQVVDQGGSVLGSVTVAAGATATKVLGVVVDVADPYDLRYVDAADGTLLAEFSEQQGFFCPRHGELHITVVSGRTFVSPRTCPALGASRPAHGRTRTVEDDRYAYTSDRGYVGPDRFDITCIGSAEFSATVLVTVTPASAAAHRAAGSTGGPPAGLPDTGIPHAVWLLVIGAGAIAVGGAALALERKVLRSVSTGRLPVA